MTDVLRLATQADRRTSPALAQLCANDIEHIWANVSAHIQSQLALQKGVHVAGLGTFTFSQQKLDVGIQSVTIQKPVFILSGKLVHSLGIKQDRPLAAASHLPVVPLNLTAVSRESLFSRDRVEACVRETVLLLVRTVASQENVLLPLRGIGILSFRNNKVQMKFSKDFIKAVDGTGSLLLALKTRPGSSASLTSDGSKFQKTQTVNFDPLPTVHSPKPEDHDRQNEITETSQHLEQKSCWNPQSAKPREVDPALHVENETHNGRPLSSPSETFPKQTDARVRCSGHTRAGQELCYLCTQRAQRNVPVSVRRQQEAQERNHEQLLLLRALHKDRLFYEQEQAKLAEHREHARGVAAFNLNMSAKRKETYSPQCPSSFIFPSRPVTPPPRAKHKQHKYMNELQTQIQQKQRHNAEEKQNRETSECLEQQKLQQEWVSVKAQQVKQKQETTERYKKALDVQVVDKKGSGLPVCQSDLSSSRVLKIQTVTSRAANKLKSFSRQTSARPLKRSSDICKSIKHKWKRRRDPQTKPIELRLDRVNRFEKRKDMSRSLENDWSQSVKLKQQREEEERRFLRSAGQLLVDKLVQYRRCAQCKRRTSNCGQSNIWRDSRYLSGSQFII
ncbi:hypothetical protein WMY93_019186 [Mugilogobius chulae]|uniref:CCDC81 HU domain-containing protein n=1 Tax=Mugilogobius chulae TaxID=88201 RepID=A0AAW0NEM2_9GOBI